MKVTPTALELIARLRNDDHTRKHFNIHDWRGRGTCGAIGCIAGTAIAIKHNFDPRRRYEDQVRNIPGYKSVFSHYEIGSEALGLSDKSAHQLFAPWEYWAGPLICPGYIGSDYPFMHLSQNEQPSPDHVKRMKEWAEKYHVVWDNMETDIDRTEHDHLYNPDACARALELHLVEEIPYVDWMTAHLETEDA